MLKINIKATNVKLDNVLRDFIYEKIGALDKFIGGLGESVEAWVEIGKPSEHHQTGPEFYAEVNIGLPGQRIILRAESSHLDLKSAIIEAKEELQKELKKYKGKQEAKYKRGARLVKKFIRLSPLAWFRKKKRERDEGI